MSASTIRTLASVWARLVAMLIAVVVFPSPGKLEVTSKVFGARPALDKSTEVRNWRYDSANEDRVPNQLREPKNGRCRCRLRCSLGSAGDETAQFTLRSRDHSERRKMQRFLYVVGSVNGVVQIFKEKRQANTKGE